MHSAGQHAAAGTSDLQVGVQAASALDIDAVCEVRDCGRMGYLQAFELQRELVEKRKQNEIADQVLFVEHPHVVTMGRNGHGENLLASPELLERSGIEFHATNRGGDVTYHGPGQVVGYPIFALRGWRRDVVAYVRGLENVLIGTLAEFGIEGSTVPGATGVWVARDISGAALPQQAKVAAIGVHVSRWVTSHGFALNVDTDLSYFRYIVPCGLTKPVTSMQTLGCRASRADVLQKLSGNFGRVFGRKIQTQS